MSHRGQNQTNDTVQIWNGTQWVAYNSLSFQTAELDAASSLWVDSDSSAGLTLGGANRRSLSPVYNGTGNPLIATKRVFAHRTGVAGGADPQIIELPKVISGVAPLLVTGPKSLLLADILLGVSHDGSSTTIGTRYVAKWEVQASGTFPYFERGVEALGNAVDADFVITNGTVAESAPNEGAPTVTVNYNGFTAADTLRYMLDITMTLVGIVE